MSTLKKLIIAGVILGVVAGAAGVWWFLKDDAPEKVSLDSAARSVTTKAGDAARFDGAEGTWTVDTETGDFDFESATGTFAGFRIAEELQGIGKTEAVGRTGDVSGSLTIEGTKLTKADFTVDLTTITTNQSRRDGRVQDALDTGEFPKATFSLTEPIDLGDAVDTGKATSVTASGDLTVHGETKLVQVKIDARVKGNTLVVVGSTDIALADFGVAVPQAPVVLSASDTATVELQLLLTPA